MSSVFPLSADRTGVSSQASVRRHVSQVGHRADVEGLRGIAVLSVLAVHTFPQWVRGGFIGVDIFFVLSGYLISGILLRSLEAGTFRYRDFYARRVRRIFPALCLVLIATLAFSTLYTFPGPSRQVGGHVAAGAMFLSNIALWKEAGYFDIASEAKPLLHLWSLGVEEQFYLVWPIVTVALFRDRRRMLWTICAVLVVSFTLNVAFVATKPTAVFFLPPARMWELMSGALLAHLIRYHGEPASWFGRWIPQASTLRRRVPDAMAGAGLAMLVTAMWLVDQTVHFPGWWAVLPTFGAFLLIGAGPSSWVGRRVLANPVLRFYGLVSYPLYLWHWPLLSFPVVLGVPLSNEVRVAILIASVALAALTYELVEKPIRLGSHRRRSIIALCTALAAIGVAGLVVQRTDGLLDTYPTELRELAAAEFRFDYADYRVDKCMLRLDQGPESFSPDCIDRTDGSRRLVFLWGDSHAAALYPGLAGSQSGTDRFLRLAQFTAARCPPMIPAPLHSSTQCDRTNRFAMETIKVERPQTVVLAGHWSLYATSAIAAGSQMASLRETVRLLHELGVERVVVFGAVPTWTMPQPRIVLKQWASTGSVPERTNQHLDPVSIATDHLIAQAMEGTGAVFVSPTATLCSAEGCLVTIRRAGAFEPVSYDESHLSTAASNLLVQRNLAAIVR
jgi:peptidoglycan/LPS O-acetylase OafA/YrhL